MIHDAPSQSIDLGTERPQFPFEETLILECATPTEIVASVLDREELEESLGAAFVPTLASSGPVSIASGRKHPAVPFAGSSSLSRLAGIGEDELLDECAERSTSDPGAPSGVVFRGGSDALLAASHALETGKRLTVLEGDQSAEDLARKTEQASSIAIAASPQQIASLGCDRLREAFSEAAGGSAHGSKQWGVLTASSAESLSRLLARTRLPRSDRHISGKLYSMEERTFPLAEAIEVVDLDLESVLLPPHPSVAMEELAREGTDFAYFVGHGRSYCALAGNLCSLTERATADDKRCVGGYECVFQGHARTPASSLRADIVLLDSCSTASFRVVGPEVEEGLNLSVQLLDGSASAVISPFRTNSPLFFAPYLFWQVSRLGWTLGRATEVLNRMAARWFDVPAPYMLLGDPELSPFGTPTRSPIEGRVRGCEDGIWDVELLAGHTGVAVYQIENEELGELASQTTLHGLLNPPVADQMLVEILPRVEDRSGIDVVAVRSVPPTSLSTNLEVVAQAPFREELVGIADTMVENLRIEKRWLDAESEGALGGFMSALKEVEVEVSTLLGFPVIDTGQFVRQFEFESRLLEECRGMSSALIESLTRRAWSDELWPMRDYGEIPGKKSLQERLRSEPCSRCGGSVHDREYSVGLWPSTLRTLAECERCMYLGDIPKGATALEIVGPETATKGEPFTVELVGRNDLEIAAWVHAVVSVDRMKNPRECFSITPETFEALVPAGEEFRFEASILLDEALPVHQFHVKAVSLVNCALSWAVRKTDVR